MDELAVNSPNERGRIFRGPDRVPLRYKDVRVEVKYTSNTNHHRITRVYTKKKKKKKRICMSLIFNSPNEGGRVCLDPDRAPLRYKDVRVEVHAGEHKRPVPAIVGEEKHVG